MRSLQLFVTFLFPLSLSATATIPAKTQSYCNTDLATTSNRVVPTQQKSATVIIPIFQYVTTTPPITKTLPATTLFDTVTKTITITSGLDQVTDTFFLTTTIIISTTIALSPSTVTIPASTTLDLAVGTTTTVPTPSGWLPAPSTIPTEYVQNPFLPSKRSLRIKERTTPSKPPSKPVKFFPKSVTCYRLVEKFNVIVFTKTAKPSTTTPPQSTVRGITTATQYTTLSLPRASTISTVEATSYLTFFSTPLPATTTSTTTISITAEFAAATSYAACQPQNFAQKVGDTNIYTYSYPDPPVGVDVQFKQPSNINGDKVACCSSCMADPNCSSWKVDTYSEGGEYCQLWVTNPGVCTRAGQYIFNVIPYGTGAPTITVGNGNCVAWHHEIR